MYCLSEDPRIPPSTNHSMVGLSQEFLQKCSHAPDSRPAATDLPTTKRSPLVLSWGLKVQDKARIISMAISGTD